MLITWKYYTNTMYACAHPIHVLRVSILRSYFRNHNYFIKKQPTACPTRKLPFIHTFHLGSVEEKGVMVFGSVWLVKHNKWHCLKNACVRELDIGITFNIKYVHEVWNAGTSPSSYTLISSNSRVCCDDVANASCILIDNRGYEFYSLPWDMYHNICLYVNREY